LKASAINEDMGDYAATAGQPADVVTILKGQQETSRLCAEPSTGIAGLSAGRPGHHPQEDLD